VLARCTQLEVLNHVLEYTPAVWLGLSQLHTLHDVDLTKVSIAAIAAALPRLHSVIAHRYIDRGANDSAAVAGFFTDLLPRLRVFRFCGNWSMAIDEAVAPAAPLPLLEELEWCDDDDQPTLLHGFLGARPMMLSAPYELVAYPHAAKVWQASRRTACWHALANCISFRGSAPRASKNIANSTAPRLQAVTSHAAEYVQGAW
jgi:hypothetical protein